MGFAPRAKDIGYCAPLATLNFLIEVDEFPAEFLCQAPPNRGFSRPHEANEINALDRHRTIYPFRPRGIVPFRAAIMICGPPAATPPFKARSRLAVAILRP